MEDWSTIYAHFVSFRGELEKFKRENPSSEREIQAKIDKYDIYLVVLRDKLIEMGMDESAL